MAVTHTQVAAPASPREFPDVHIEARRGWMATKHVTHWLDEWAGILNIPSRLSVSPLESQPVEQERRGRSLMPTNKKQPMRSTS